ncbi:extracellular catalytic domain type 1 short-chain-length polyhydroxyalkanoate depolymerase [Sphaerisporangium corydalis]|uniref:PHB depolymerase family esterase n=1 Tax=Sphaerisporangium corydalis TaxID=1441875 RepID=A0ABV9EAQ8_9ACTN|nr:PHB depolymerase family esterase [Sphaerisporangium corydalis]
MFVVLVALLGAMVAVVPRPASAASLTAVSGFGSNPGNLSMYSYRPDGLPSGAPLVVAMHGCTQNATDYFGHSGWQKYADLWKFALVLPEQKSGNNGQSCFNWFLPGDTARGQGEALSVKQMVDYAVANYGSAASKVYVTGLSAGGAMTSVMLATYPDVFAGGAVMSGIAYGCGTDQVSGTLCLSQNKGYSAQKWGDLARAGYPGYSGTRPRVAIWQGTSDYTVYPFNADQLRDQWTNVAGVSQSPTGTSSLPGGTTLKEYGSAVKVYTISGMAHGLPVSPGSAADQCGSTGAYYISTICSSYYVATTWGLNGGGTTPPPGGPSAPGGLAVTGVTGASVSLSWSAVSGAAGYHVYRNGTRVTTSAVSGTTYTDGGLTAGTGYSYAVSAVNSAGTEGARSGTVTGTTTGSGGGGTCVTSSNYAHTTAGRAHVSGGLTYANGSNQAMGLWNVAVTHTLRQTATNYWVLADGQC